MDYTVGVEAYTMNKLPQMTPEGLLVLASTRADDGTLGDGVRLLKPTDPEYDKWVQWMRQRAELDAAIAAEDAEANK